jgi:hypothetical protein
MHHHLLILLSKLAVAHTIRDRQLCMGFFFDPLYSFAQVSTFGGEKTPVCTRVVARLAVRH